MPGAHADLIGGSTCARRFACPGSYRLEQQAPTPPSSKYADEGTMLHYFTLEKIFDQQMLPDDLVGSWHAGQQLTANHLDEMIWPALKQIDALLDRYAPGQYSFIAEARVSYPGYEDVFGTCDLIIDTDEATIVADLKFGRGVMVSIEDNYQLRFYAGAAMLTDSTADMFHPDKPIVLAIIQPANPEPLQVREVSHVEIDTFAGLVDDLAHRILNESDDLEFETGDHCRWCNAAATCPEKNKQIDLMLKISPTQDPFIDPVEFGQLVKMAEEADAWAKAVRRTAYNELKKGCDIDGYKLVEKRRTRVWTDEAAAADRMRTAGLNDPYDRAILSPAKAEKSVKELGGSPRDLADLIEARSSGLTMAPSSDRRAAVNPSSGALPAPVDLKLPQEG